MRYLWTEDPNMPHSPKVCGLLKDLLARFSG